MSGGAQGFARAWLHDESVTFADLHPWGEGRVGMLFTQHLAKLRSGILDELLGEKERRIERHGAAEATVGGNANPDVSGLGSAPQADRSEFFINDCRHTS